MSKNMSQQTPCGPKHHIERQKCSFWSIIGIFGHFLSTGRSETENFKFFLQNMKSSGDFVSENMLQNSSHATLTQIVDTKFRNIESVLASALSPARELIGSFVILCPLVRKLNFKFPRK